MAYYSLVVEGGEYFVQEIDLDRFKKDVSQGYLYQHEFLTKLPKETSTEKWPDSVLVFKGEIIEIVKEKEDEYRHDG